MNDAIITIYKTTKAAVEAMPMRYDEEMRGPQSAACFAVYTELVAQGMDKSKAFSTSTDICWRIETGKPMPAWLDEMGNQTAASRAYNRSFDAHHHS